MESKLAEIYQWNSLNDDSFDSNNNNGSNGIGIASEDDYFQDVITNTALAPLCPDQDHLDSLAATQIDPTGTSTIITTTAATTTATTTTATTTYYYSPPAICCCLIVNLLSK